MKTKLTILCENSVSKPITAIAEHGFACLVETPAGSYLFDCGQGLGIVRNALSLYKDLGKLQGIILSHGHYDHAGGLPEVLRQTGRIEVFAHPDIFAERYWAGSKSRRFIGIPHRLPFLASLGADFCYRSHFCRIAPGLYLTGEVPRQTSFEQGDPHMEAVGADGAVVRPDPLLDDLSLIIDTDKGLTILLGCAHAGTVNILNHIMENLPGRPLHAIIGGTHLSGAGEEQFEQTVKTLKRLCIDRIGVSHCTGLERAAQLQTIFKERFFFAGIGTELEI